MWGRPPGAREAHKKLGAKMGGGRTPHFGRLSRALGPDQTSKTHPKKSGQIAFRYSVVGILDTVPGYSRDPGLPRPRVHVPGTRM